MPRIAANYGTTHARCERAARTTPLHDSLLPMNRIQTHHTEQNAPHRSTRRLLWFSWLLGLSMLAAVIVAAIHFSQERELLRIAEEAEPWWLALAVSLQVGTYLAQGETWRVVTRAAGVDLPSLVAFKLSLAKLFIDQALPSAGISGTVVVANALEQRGLARSVVMAAVVVDSVGYYAACVLMLGVALVIAIAFGHASPLILAASVIFVVISATLATTALALSGRKRSGPEWLNRIPGLGKVLSLIREADPTLARGLPLLCKSGLLQLSIILLDAATVWILILSLGQVASPTGVFASFVISTLLRTVGIVPGGLGVFEAASVVTLKLAGVAVPVALAATLLFRGLSFWLPMVPGLIFSRGAKKMQPE